VAWTNPFTAVTSNIITAADWNTSGRDDLNYLKGLLDGTGADDVYFPGNARLNDLKSLSATGLGSARARLQFVTGTPHITYNAVYDSGSATWLRDDTTRVAWRLTPGSDAAITDRFELYRAAAGANPITWTAVVQIESTGKWTGATVWNSGRFAVAAGATVDTNHAWLTAGLRPAFVLGFYQAGTQTPDNNIQQVCGMGPASTEKVRITLVDGSKVRVVSGDSVSNTVVLYAILGPTS
jgi:hypothetical protein